MDVVLDLLATPARLRFEGALTIAEAAAGRERVLALLDGLPAGPVQLDLDQVSEADGAGVQLVLAAARSLRAAGHEPRFGACSPGLRRAAEALGAAFAEGTR